MYRILIYRNNEDIASITRQAITADVAKACATKYVKRNHLETEVRIEIRYDAHQVCVARMPLVAEKNCAAGETHWKNYKLQE